MPQYKELDTLRSFTAKLNIALSTLPVPRLFADLLVQDKLVGEAAARNIVSPTGIDDYNKVSRLMSAVYSYVQTVSSQEKATLIFNKLVIILHNDPLGLEDLAQQLVQHRGTLFVSIINKHRVQYIIAMLNIHAFDVIISCHR